MPSWSLKKKMLRTAYRVDNKFVKSVLWNLLHPSNAEKNVLKIQNFLENKNKKNAEPGLKLTVLRVAMVSFRVARSHFGTLVELDSSAPTK